MNDEINQLYEVLKTEEKKKERSQMQSETLHGIYIATVVDTLDPLKQGRVRYYTPFLSLKDTDKHALPWASPLSPFGGFDDGGAPWVPPAGSKIAIMFINGDRDNAIYLGSIWNRDRGVVDHLASWDYPVSEYDALWEGKRNGYLVGSNAGDQVFPPWNNESYNGYDTDSIVDFYSDPTQLSATTYPHIKGMKTEEKHMLKFVDGDPRCNKRNKRVELASGRGNIVMMKDDHLHPASQWAFGAMTDLSNCHMFSEDPNSPLLNQPKEKVCCDDLPDGCVAKTCPETGTSNSSIDRTTKFANPYYKRYEEMRIHYGANTPQGNKCELDQSGIQIQSISGQQFVMDDSVNQPTGVPTWDRDFDFGCDDTFRGKMFFRSATGHYLELNDEEEVGNGKIRGEENGVRIRTACGNFFEMSDHSTTDTPCEPKFAGERSGITMSTRSTHLFQMNDSRLKQSSPVRTDGGIPKKADESGFEGYVLLRSGYGMQLLMKDTDRQDETNEQFLQLMAPQKDNLERGPHMLVMQEAAEGAGLVMLRSGGVLYQGSYDESVEVVGADPDNPASKFTSVTDNYVVDVKHMYFNHNEMTVYWADDYIFLLAGRDCPPPEDAEDAVEESNSQQSQSITNAQSEPGSTAGQSEEGSPCIYNVITSKDPWVCPFTKYVHYGVLGGEDGVSLDSRSQRVFVSASAPTGSEDE